MDLAQILKAFMRIGSHFLLLCVFLSPKGSNGNGDATAFPCPNQVPLILLTHLGVVTVHISVLS